MDKKDYFFFNLKYSYFGTFRNKIVYGFFCFQHILNYVMHFITKPENEEDRRKTKKLPDRIKKNH